MLKIAFPEFDNPTIKQALATHSLLTSQDYILPYYHTPLTKFEAIPTRDLQTACELVRSGAADTIIVGIDYSTRDVILTCREYFSMTNLPPDYPFNKMSHLLPSASRQLRWHSKNRQSSSKSLANTTYRTFSGLTVLSRDDNLFLLSDVAACKHPTVEQLTEIIYQTYLSAQKLLQTPPVIALLSFSSFGSGGHDETIDLLQTVLGRFSGTNILIDGEMQLDTAIIPHIGQKKFPESRVAGRANVLIAPDLNSGNLLYKSFEHLAGFTAAGPILQGFTHPISDLSRGSSVADIIFTIESLARLL